MRRVALLIVLAALPLSAEQTFDLRGYVAARAVNATGPRSWLAGDFGRLEANGGETAFFGSAHVGADWTPSEHFDVHVSGTARHDPEELGGDQAGFVEAYADLRAVRNFDELQLRVGQFFLPTSRENRDPLWASPYTVNFSALNTWMGEEVRPVGADLQYLHTSDRGHVITAGATAFKANDTMGTLLAWRGWSVGDRLTVWDEVLPLPPLGSLDTYFFRQRDDGTKPFGPDLDGKTGYSARLRYSIPQRGSIQYTWLDNRGDLKLYRGEYAWYTTFELIGADIGDPDALSAAAEYISGYTEMGTFATYVESKFHAGYLLVSQKKGRNRWTARYDVFDATEADHTDAERNDEEGSSWTVSWMYDLTPKTRAALEYTTITGDRPAAAQYGFDPVTDAHSWTLELRYRF